MEQRNKTGRATVDDRGNSVWTFVDDAGQESTVRTARVLALGDELSLVQTGLHQAAPVAQPAAVKAPPSAPKFEPPAVASKPPRKPMSRQELQKLSDEIVRQRKLREAQAKK